MRVSHYLLPVLMGCTALSALTALTVPTPSFAQGVVGVSITLAPPALPDYEQPPMPASGYIWTPGYWQYGAMGYYWVPGTWVEPPMVGLLWTPGYWGWNAGFYVWNAPYWGASVGYYGGINYGYGYGGNGYAGGRWNNGHFDYNRSVNNFGSNRITNFYNQPVASRGTVNHASFNGGTGGVQMRPTSAQIAVGQQQHTPPTAVQTQHFESAAANPALQHNANNGRPPIAATSRPAEFTGQGVVGARGGTIAAPANAARPGTAPALRAPATAQRPAVQAPSTGMQPQGGVQPQRATGAPGPAIQAHPTQQQAAPQLRQAPAAEAPRVQAPSQQQGAPQTHQAPAAQAPHAQAPSPQQAAPQTHQAPAAQAPHVQAPSQAAPQQQHPQQQQQPHPQQAAPAAHAAPPPQAHPAQQQKPDQKPGG